MDATPPLPECASEKVGKVFHSVECSLRARIAEGKFRFGTRAKRGPKPTILSIVWKNFEKVFHCVENGDYHL